ncbi:hypothetical protein Z517_07816 [Fonsecaea pedrosoi CBS 271.37]|uniref:Zn(2)-C6 fungal-type domain-containing protein n=1 Tax=Fonsecaea pedrosoi CBS 271.37 TaxID=1442368 RepID=A0A0D2GBJ0_9EURO|nr:uncharacterized protein Z517_07816 [Fonsecaea pedrosoi CBS 271.37]KIW77983.1 hypothetical protein Z517_07816 [Fonsecaea pedrosoi CBS 271.37]
MVFCRAPSKGCELCRKRKVKCDEGRPGCLKCARLKQKCPGYRNLDQVRIRDESDRVARRCRQEENSSMVWASSQTAIASLQNNTPASRKEYLAISRQQPVTIARSLSPSSHDLGANFFFVKYSPKDCTFNNHHAWLTKSYFDQGPNNVLRKVIEAVGMAGLSNVFDASHIKSQARAQYSAALASMQKALHDPIQAVSDTTFMALMLLAFFETINCEALDRCPEWVAHIRAGAAVLELRGQDQFSSERGGMLYVQFRSYLLLACMQENVAVPNALVKATFNFQTGTLRQNWQRANIASPGSITEICFRLANLRAAMKDQGAIDPQAIRATALEIDADLETWRAGLPPSWKYTTVSMSDAANDTHFAGKMHVYPNLWIAEAWNSWRAARILVNQLILQNEACVPNPDNALTDLALSTIRQLCIDICISTHSFRDSPRKYPLGSLNTIPLANSFFQASSHSCTRFFS